MSKKIHAEFDSIDSAELCARAVKHTLKGIMKISIRSKGVKSESDLPLDNVIPAGAINYSGYSTGMYTPAFAPLIGVNGIDVDRGDDASSRERGREATLEIQCEDAAIHSVSQLLTGLGGLKIRTF